jgi:Sugar transferases involved in lipopolysaccharide synthesis
MTVQTAQKEDIAPFHDPRIEVSTRVLDLLIAVPALIFALPLLALVAVAVRLDSPGPALFRQTRVGRFGVPFTLLKFRTMAWGTPDIPTAEMAKQARCPVTRVGAFLRRYSLDELPQLLNVVRGEMSLVGPRPALPSQTELNAARRAAGVDLLRPGITGWAQINGRDDLSDAEKVACDAYYARNRSLALDIKILLYTFLPVLTGKGNR